MCGIVKRPTGRNDFDPSRFSRLSKGTVRTIVGVCEDTHIPFLATSLVLAFAEKMADRQNLLPNFVMQNIPFAIYKDGKRYVTEESVLMEEAVMHLAMTGSVRYHINQELVSYGLFLEMGHCCDIQMHSMLHREEAMALSHDVNVYRADKLRSLTEADTVVISASEFLAKIECAETRSLTSMMQGFAHKETCVA